jgi:hemoglobin
MSDIEQPTLFERLGRRDGLAAVVADLYDRILGDDELAHFFHGVAVDTVQRHQLDLVTTAVGGPSVFTGRSLHEAHAGLDIQPRHVELVIAHLDAALAHSGVAPTDSATVVAQVRRLWVAQFWPA